MTDLLVFNLKSLSLSGELTRYFNFLIVIMSKARNSKKISVQRGKNENVEEASMNPKTLKVDLGNASPHHSNESYISSHSTPIRKRDHVTYVEDSPELDYHYSPISLPCTQEGGNEIAWDWQTPVYKNLNEKPKTPTNHVETPKRTKLLQKKGNSNSPVLQKPLKGKQVTTENMENIGKLKAALKALDEKVKNIKKNDDNVATEKDDNRKREADSRLVVELDNDTDDDIMIEAVVNNDKLKINSVPTNSNIKNDYEDLFDDSIDDSMVRCSQEIEKKLNLCKSDAMEVSVLSEIKEASSTSETESRHLTTTSIKSSSSSSFKTSSTSTSGHLRTYSNNSSKTNKLSNISSSMFSSNNVTNMSNEKQTLKDKSTSDFPDDSFDDCLATCMEDDKLLSKLSEYEFSPTKTGRNASSSKKNSKQQAASNSAIAKKTTNKSTAVITDDLNGEVDTVADIETIRNSFRSKSALDNRKFFKTRSLSDQCFFKVNLLEKRFQSNNMPVSTFPTVRERGDDNCAVKYKSTSNLSSVKESQPVQCTAEEIERKRMEAKMRLEAKRKLQAGVGDTPSEVPVKRSVKR